MAWQLSPETLGTLVASAHTIGVLLWPAKGTLPPSTRAYHLRRLADVAKRFAPISCRGGRSGRVAGDAEQLLAGDAEQQPWAKWLDDHDASCEHSPAHSAARFAHAPSNATLAALLGPHLAPSALGSLLAALRERNLPGAAAPARGAPPASERAVRFALLRRRAGGDAAGGWRAHVHRGDMSVDAIDGFVRRWWQHAAQTASNKPARTTPKAANKAARDEL